MVFLFVRLFMSRRLLQDLWPFHQVFFCLGSSGYVSRIINRFEESFSVEIMSEIEIG